MSSSVNPMTEEDIERKVLRKYYQENNYSTSPEGIFKMASIAVCIAMSVVSLLSVGNMSSGRLGAVAAVLGAGALLTLICAVNALSFAAYAPMTCFYIDLVVSTVIGACLLVIAILNLTFYELNYAVDYIYAPLAIINACFVLTSAVFTYLAITQRWESVRKPAITTSSSDISELDI